MAQENSVFGWMGLIHPRFHTPHIAIVLQAVWSSFLVASSSYRDLFTRVVYTEWLFFALMTAGLFRLRRSAGYAPSYRVWGYPVVPLAFAAGAVIVACCQIAADPWKACSGLALIMIGWLVYRLGVYRSRGLR